MAKKPISQKKADKEREDNKVLTRVYYVFLLGLAAECYLFLVHHGYTVSISSMLTWYTVLSVLMWVGLAALAVGAAVWYVKREDRKLRKIMPWVAGVGAFFALSGWVSTHVAANTGEGITLLCVMVPILAIFVLIYLLYQHECALSTVALGGAMFSVWVRSVSVNSARWMVPVIVGCVVALVLLAAAAYLSNKAQKAGGKLKKVQVLSLECDYRILYAALAVAAVGVLIGLLLPAISVYLMWLLGVALFAELVYYTTKLM